MASREQLGEFSATMVGITSAVLGKTMKKRKNERLYRGLQRDPEHPWRAENLGRLLLVATDRWQNAFVAGLREAGYRKVTSIYMNLMRHVDLNGTRLTELADRVGTTKQAVGQLISTCAKLGLVNTVKDPSDGRAKIVVFTVYGRNAMLTGQRIIEQMDADISLLLGRHTQRALRSALRVLATKRIAMPRSPGRRPPRGGRQRRPTATT